MLNTLRHTLLHMYERQDTITVGMLVESIDAAIKIEETNVELEFKDARQFGLLDDFDLEAGDELPPWD